VKRLYDKKTFKLVIFLIITMTICYACNESEETLCKCDHMTKMGAAIRNGDNVEAIKQLRFFKGTIEEKIKVRKQTAETMENPKPSCDIKTVYNLKN
jgi:hypothetical protein